MSTHVGSAEALAALERLLAGRASAVSARETAQLVLTASHPNTAQVSVHEVVPLENLLLALVANRNSKQGIDPHTWHAGIAALGSVATERMFDALVRYLPAMKSKAEAWLPFLTQCPYPTVLALFLRRKCADPKSVIKYVEERLPEVYQTALLDASLTALKLQRGLPAIWKAVLSNPERPTRLMSRATVLQRCLEMDRKGAAAELACALITGGGSGLGQKLGRLILVSPRAVPGFLRLIDGVRPGKKGIARFKSALDTIGALARDLPSALGELTNEGRLAATATLALLRSAATAKLAEFPRLPAESYNFVPYARSLLSQSRESAGRVLLALNERDVLELANALVDAAREDVTESRERVMGRLDVLRPLLELIARETGDTLQRSGLRALLFNQRLREVGAVGEVVRFDTAKHEVASGSPLPGDEVELLETTWVLEGLVVRKGRVRVSGESGRHV